MLAGVSIKSTEKRERMLALVLSSERPLSAYEIMDRFNTTFNEHMIVNSVYRILDCLASCSLVHKLATINKYIACSLPECKVGKHRSVFVICTNCHKTYESVMTTNLHNEINDITAANLTDGVRSNIELQGVCKDCQCNAGH